MAQHFTAAQIKKITSRPEYADGTYRAKVVASGPIEGDTAPEGIQLKLSMLQDPDDVNSAHRITMFQRLAVAESSVSGPIADFMFQQTAQWMAALDENLEGIPTWNKETQQNEVNGELVDKSEVKELTETRSLEALNRAVDLFEGGQEEMTKLVGECIYVDVVRTVSKKDGKTYANMNNPRREIAEGTELVNKDDFIYVAPDSDEVEEEVAPAKTVKKAASPAKKSKR